MTKPKRTRTGQVRMQQAYEMHMVGKKTIEEVAEIMGIQRKSVINFVWRVRGQIETEKHTCAGCGKTIEDKTELFREKFYHGDCLQTAESSLCEKMPITGWDPVYHRRESIFDSSASAPRRTHGGMH